MRGCYLGLPRCALVSLSGSGCGFRKASVISGATRLDLPLLGHPGS